MVVARLAKNKHEIEIMVDGRRIDIVDAAIEYEGKRQLLVLKIGDFKILPESACPERNRYERIMQAFGKPEEIAALEPACSMIQINARACSGCKDRPI